jgi:hypothetical protein
MLESADEHWHLPTKQLHWNESFYFNCFDTETGWAFATRVGVAPNANDQDGFVCLYLPDQSTGFVRTAQTLDEDRSRIASGGIDLRCLAPFRTWQIRYDGPIHHFKEAASDDDLRRTLDAQVPIKHLILDLEFSALHPPFDYDERTVRMRSFAELIRGPRSEDVFRSLRRTFRTLVALPAMMRAHHYEQSGRVRGTATLDGKPSDIHGFGQRDHSWGVRDMRAPSSWRWLSCQFGEDFCFNATQVDVLGMRVQGGFVFHDGLTEAVTSWQYDATHTTSRFWPDTLGVVLTLKSGHRFALEAETVSPLPVIARTDDHDVLVSAARAKYHWGGRSADGMVEYMERPR